MTEKGIPTNGQDAVSQQMILALREARTRLAASESARTEPIAVIGVGCRLPGGADNPDLFWHLLENGVDAVTEVPRDRWNIDDYYDPNPEIPGKIYTRAGAFLQLTIDRFDPLFFGISPREAVGIDPQHRLLLEVSWEALEHAGQDPTQLRHSRTGVFMSICWDEYAEQVRNASNSETNTVHTGLGTLRSIGVGRISYLLGLQGPNIQLDTACSSSLVAVHLACQSLRSQECEMALAGGVNLLISPLTTLSRCQAKTVSPDGRCKTFDASADGYGQGEGCGVVVLKRLSDALASNDPILALVRGSAINHDGPSNGLTAPNEQAQETLIRQALKNARVKPQDIQYIEAHGTGTSLGDPIEIGALNEVFGSYRSQENPLRIGSVKTNIGHLEGAAGISGFIKLVLSLQHEAIPAHLNFHTPNPHIDWDELPFQVTSEQISWGRGQGKRLAGVSSFGISGTNAHIVLEEAPLPSSRVVSVERTHHLLTLAAKSQPALEQLALTYKNHLSAHPHMNMGDLCFTASTGRSHFDYRLGVVGTSISELSSKLEDVINGEDSNGIARGKVSEDRAKVAFLFTGQGSQYKGMGKKLYETEPIFKETLEHCAEILASFLDVSLWEILFPKSESDCLLNQTAYTQPSLFAFEYALYKLWQSWGIQADTVMGHSVGEYVAACAAGVVSLEDGLKLITTRGQLMQKLPPGGVMVSLIASVDRVRRAIADLPEVAIAAINGSESVVISGPVTAIQAVVTQLETVGIKSKILQVSHAFHSPLMQPMVSEFEQVAREVSYSLPQTLLISNVTGQVATEEVATPEYWCRHILAPVNFMAGMRTLYQQGCDVFLECGPQPMLLGMGRQCLPDAFGIWLPSLRPGVNDWQQMLDSLGRLYVQGVEIDWLGFNRDSAHRKVVLPTYPFQRQRYWVESNDHHHLQQPKQQPPIGKTVHPLLGQRIFSPSKQQLFQAFLSEDKPVYLKHHRVFDHTLFPTTAYLEMALAAGRQSLKVPYPVVEDLVICQGMILPDGDLKTVQTMLTPSDQQSYQFEIFSQYYQDAQDEPEWILHASGTVRAAQTEMPPAYIDLKKYQTECCQPIEVEQHYRRYQTIGISYGPSFRGVQQIWVGNHQAIAHIELPQALQDQCTDYLLHPTLLDAASQVVMHALPENNDQQTYLPVGIGQLQVYERPSVSLWAWASVTNTASNGSQGLTTQVILINSESHVIATLQGIQFKPATSRALLGDQSDTVADLLYEVEWRSKTRFGRLLPHNFPALQTVAEIVNSSLPTVLTQNNLNTSQEIQPQLEDLSVEYIIQALHEMGWTDVGGETFTLDAVITQLGIVPSQRPLFRRLLQILTTVGVVQEKQGQWQALQELHDVNPGAQQQVLLKQFPHERAALTLLHRCASRLSRVLQGTQDPMELVFPDGDLTAATQLYEESPVAKVMNRIVQHAITQVVETIPASRGLRLLEIGAGTGGTTSYILPHLEPSQTEYVFTDIGALFTQKAQEKFKDYPFLSYHVLDIEADPVSQGFETHQYDVVIAANVLHATTNLHQTLHHVRTLLAPGGLLVLLEGTTPLRWVDLIFGLLDGWWKFNDPELRPDYPLLNRTQWHQLLKETGFSEVLALPNINDVPAVLAQNAVILAQADVPPLELVSDPGSWLLLADQQGIARRVATRLRSVGEECILACIGKQYQQVSAQEFTINPSNPAEFEQLANQVVSERSALKGVIHCWMTETGAEQGFNGQKLERLSHLGCGTTLSLVQALVKKGFSPSPKLWLVTQGSQPVPHESPEIPGVAQASVWGLGKVIDLEHPELNCVRIDLDPQASLDRQAWELFSEVWAQDSEDQIALRGDNRYVARLVSYRYPETESIAKTPVSFRENVSYLITGGFGGLGLLVVRWMVEKGARRLVLLGRRAPSQEALNKLADLEQVGAQIVIEEADVSDFSAMAGVIDRISQSSYPLAGIIHAAGMLSDGVLQNQSWSSFEQVMAPKVQGTWHLHQLTQKQSLEFFILFSSGASLFGSAGQGNHSAANAFLDGVAHYRRAMGLPGLSIHWGAVTQVGEAAERGADVRASQQGIGVVITPTQVLEVLERLMQSPFNVEVGALPINWSAWQERVAQWPFLSDWEQEVTLGEASVTQKNQLLEQLRSDLEDNSTLLESYLCNKVAHVLNMELDQISVRQSLNMIGLDSLMSVELRNQLKTDLGIDIPSTRFMQGISISELVDEVSQRKSITSPVQSIATERITIHQVIQQSDERVRGEL